MKKIIRNKHDLIIGISENFNLEKLSDEKIGQFNIPVKESSNEAYKTLYKQSKLQDANIAIVEEVNAHSMKGTFYLSKGNPFNTDNFKGSSHFDYTSKKYTLLY